MAAAVVEQEAASDNLGDAQGKLAPTDEHGVSAVAEGVSAVAEGVSAVAEERRRLSRFLAAQRQQQLSAAAVTQCLQRLAAYRHRFESEDRRQQEKKQEWLQRKRLVLRCDWLRCAVL